ncbi:MAG: M6 family metalloprotease domain-containing protein [Actinomycetota bacterium]
MLRSARGRTAVIALGLLISLTIANPGSAQVVEPLPDDLDPVSHVLPEHMTWDDYRAVPGFDWTNPAYQPPRKVRAALILADFEDQPMVVEELGLTEDPADFYKRMLVTEPSAINHRHTINEYWLEDSFGVVGIDADAFGPYTMPGKLHEYGITSDMNNPGMDCPGGSSCNQGLDNAVITASAQDVTTGIATNGGRDYDFRFLLHAGWDESGTWEEFGPMLFANKEDVTDDVDTRTSKPYGNPDPAKNNWAKTRYNRPDGPWTSFFSAQMPWAHATPGVYSLQGESDGASVFAHELSHIFGVLDNYGSPFVDNADRDYSGPWDMLSRGTFNGPGGPHNRWHVPAKLGATMGSHHMLRTKVRLGFVSPADVLYTTQRALNAGPVIADVLQREQPMTPAMRLNGLKYGINVALGRDTGDTACPRPGKARCDGGGYDNYTVEVVNRVGYDSFTPDHGVLIAKTKNADLLPFLWVVDSHPDDIGAIDYIKPNGEPQPYRFGDYRQLSDALFHVGRKGTNELGKGLAVNGETANSYEDTGNAVKFLVLDKREDAAGVLSYRVAVLSTTPSPALTYGVQISGEEVTVGVEPGKVATYKVRLTNTGSATDIFRVAASGQGADTKILNDLVEIGAGQSKTVTVHIRPSAECYSLSFTATSEGDTSKTASTSTPPCIP